LRLSVCDSAFQCSHREATANHRSIHSPPDDLAREAVEDHCQVHELSLQTDIGDIGHPELIDTCQPHAAGQVQMHLIPVLRIRSADEPLPLNSQQIVLAHHPRHPLAIRFRSSAP
jgi:hypothetical protein